MIAVLSENPAKGAVVLQKDHAELSYQLAKVFGNKNFEAASPKDLIEFLALHHDRGWDQTDAVMARDPATGLPYSLTSTPTAELLKTGPRSAWFNAQYHPYCGILTCMHVWGLFNGRYGLSDKVVLDLMPGEAQEKAAAMLHEIEILQAGWTQVLEVDRNFRQYLVQDKLMQNYQALQFFDTLALYFNESALQANEIAIFYNVPMTRDQTSSIEVKPLGQKVFRINPFPFAGEKVELKQKVHEIPVLTIDVDYSKVFFESPWRFEPITLVP